MTQIQKNSQRFHISKDAIEYISSNPLQEIKDIAKPKDFHFSYSGDEDFKQFFRMDIQKADLIIKHYPQIDTLLQNIYFENIFDEVEKFGEEILEKITKNSNKKTLNIINVSPLEGAVFGSLLSELGFKNVVYNFNRSFFVNSSSKTLEAFLYIFAFKASPYFINRIKNISLKIKYLFLDFKQENHYIIIDENNNKEKYSHLEIDDYLKTQIALKNPKNIYRLDKYPDESFLHSKEITQINIFDNDKDFGQAYNYYKNIISTIPVKKESYKLTQNTKIGYFEDYLLSQNTLYEKYKKEILQKAYKEHKKSYTPDSKSKRMYNPNLYLNAKKSPSIKSQKDYSILPYLILFPILAIAFLAADSSPNGTIGGTRSTGSYFFSTGGWGSSFSNGSSISTSSSSSSKSIIKSFGGGGFSKGTT